MSDNNQLAKGEEIIQVLDDGSLKNLGKLTDDWIENRAANLVKNNVPNYAYVSNFVKGLRQYPVGNFAFSCRDYENIYKYCRYSFG